MYSILYVIIYITIANTCMFVPGQYFVDVSRNRDHSLLVSCGIEVDTNCLVSYNYTTNSSLTTIIAPGHEYTFNLDQTLLRKDYLFEITVSVNSSKYLWRFLHSGKSPK